MSEECELKNYDQIKLGNDGDEVFWSEILIMVNWKVVSEKW